ncbi:hypothetical protein BLJAPNOD_02844 [Ensifer sp. M14]|uniref:hypothetical protein n=1 Tax=Ensifer sp. M14 TaxID=2203782 RepID=UPI000E1CDE8B|nr:hypothetical protein [Ensifer sp. M14]RDL51707.1 hypothetical protein BLJAPNOD_02844 [Ensifer sp. M14]
MKKMIRILLTIVIATTVVLGFRWYQYVDNRQSPFDEVGIALNAMMPGPVRQWGCGRLKRTFGNGLPPHGCAASNGSEWE